MSQAAFKALRERRRRYVESAQENDFEEGLRLLLSDLYPDNAHFIFELLQNAEDARAKVVEFELEPTKLLVRHDGTRPFTLADVDSITGIGQSTKRDDETQIGKFGIGFKAVFAYTNRPVVRSGEYCFAIEDLFVPESVEGSARPGWTEFEFPFDREKKSPEAANSEVSQGLLELDEKTLLFLSSIERISHSIDGAKSGEVRRSHKTSSIVRIDVLSGANAESSQWLRVSRDVSDAAEGASRQLTVAAAFKLAARAAKPGESARESETPFSVVPLDRGDVSIYFPAEKEYSGLKFHVHAPFASTVARDSVRQVPENRELVGILAEALVESMPVLRDAGLIDDGFLAALPTPEDDVSQLFEPVRSAVIDAFNRDALTPVRGGGFRPAEELVASPGPFRRLLAEPDLQVLMPDSEANPASEPAWIADRDGRAGRFLSSLSTRPFGWEELDSALSELDWQCLYDEVPESWLSWLSGKSDKQIRNLYLLIGIGLAEDEMFPDLDNIPLVRLHRRNGVEHVVGSDTYLPESRSDRVAKRVSPELAYFDDEVGKDSAALREFYSKTGVERWNERSRIEERLKRYKDRGQIEADARHFEDLRAFAKFAQSYPGECRPLFAKARLFLDCNDVWSLPSQICLDDPYDLTYFGELFAKDENVDPLHPIYLDEVDGITEFAKSAGCIHDFAITSANIYRNPEMKREHWEGKRERSPIKRDWLLPKFKAAVETGNPNLLRRVWKLAQETPSSYATASFRINASHPTHSLRSLLAQQLTNATWVLGRDGRLHKPSEISVDDLADDWQAPREGSLAAKVGLGAADAARQAADEVDAFRAKQLGLSLENLEVFRELEKFLQPDELRGLAADWKSSREFESPVAGQGGGGGSRLVSYVSTGEGDGPNEPNIGSIEASPVDRAGVDRVLEYERSRGRVPEEQTHSNPGFDVLSHGADGKVLRRIEVKSLAGKWLPRGVLLSPRQVEEATRHGDQFWLYVVENAKDDEGFAIHRIQNPAARITDYAFDNGWAAAREPEVELDESGAPVAASTRNLLQRGADPD